MSPGTKNALKTFVIFVGTAAIVTTLCVVGVYYAVKPSAEITVTPDSTAATAGNTVEEHIKLDQDYQAACQDMERVLEKCDRLLDDCMDTLEHHAVILPTGGE